MLPNDFPVFLRVCRFHNELVAGKLEGARKIFADQIADQRAFDMKRFLKNGEATN